MAAAFLGAYVWIQSRCDLHNPCDSTVLLLLFVVGQISIVCAVVFGHMKVGCDVLRVSFVRVRDFCAC